MNNKNPIKNTKELYAILSSIFCINSTGSRDNDINNIVEYAFERVLNGNTNLLVLGCIGRHKEQILPEVMQILNQDTQYQKFLKESKRLHKFKPNPVFTVLVDWVNDSGESEVKSYLFSTLEKAQEQFRKEAIDELGAHRGEDIFCDEGCEPSFIKELLDEFDDDFNHMNNESNADFVIDARPDYFSCYKQGEYGTDHFDVRIIEQQLDECSKEIIKEEK